MLRILTVLIALVFSSSVWAHGSCHPSTHKVKQSFPQSTLAQTPTLWVRGGYTFSALRQTKKNDTKLYSDRKWAKGPTTDVFGNKVERWTQACLATVYAMIEHARGNAGYRVGQDNTWIEPDGPVTIAGATKQEIAPTVELFHGQFRLGNPVILKGKSDSVGTDHFMLAIGIKANNDIVALDPYTGRMIDVVNTGANNWSVALPGMRDTYTLQSVRKIKM